MIQDLWLPLKIIGYGLGSFLVVLYLMYFEQRLIGFLQMRRLKGNTLGLRDLFFPIALLINLFRVRLLFPETPHKFLYVLLPFMLALGVFLLGTFIPFHKTGLFWKSDYGILWVIVIFHLGIFLMLLTGWVSQTQYTLQGIIRLFGHFVASGLLLVMTLMVVALWAGSMNFVHIIQEQKSLWFVVPLFPVFLVHMVVLLMRGRVSPFGASESGLDLMGGYKSRYTGGLSVLVIVSEYCHFLFLSALTVVLFFGGWLPFWDVSYISGFACFFLKLIFFLMMIWGLKAILPNMRHDQFIRLSFKFFLPLIGGLALFYSLIKVMMVA
ncbi:MAG: NADH-quinone oxidoreductase subunit H [Alphaproteobacteria bacterium]